MGPPLRGSDLQMPLIYAEFIKNTDFNKICNKDLVNV